MSAKIQCGTLKQQADKSFIGPVRLIGRLDGALQLVPFVRGENSGDKSPNYDVYYRVASGTAFHVGAAWIIESERIGEFLSMSIGHPDWESDLSLTAFPPNARAGDKTGEWHIVWSRPRAARVQEQEAA